MLINIFDITLCEIIKTRMFLEMLSPFSLKSGPRVMELKNGCENEDTVYKLNSGTFLDLLQACVPTSISSNSVNVMNTTKPAPIRKKVNFVNKVSVILIPQRIEFVNAGLGEELWWSSSDYEKFKKIAVKEITEYMHDAGVDLFTAVNCLYHSMSVGSKDGFGECEIS